MECHVGACGYASGGHVVPGVYPGRDVVSQYVGTEADHPRECFVLCSSGLPVEDARTRDDGGACADGAHELDALVHRDYPIQEFSALRWLVAVHKLGHERNRQIALLQQKGCGFGARLKQRISHGHVPVVRSRDNRRKRTDETRTQGGVSVGILFAHKYVDDRAFAESLIPVLKWLILD